MFRLIIDLKRSIDLRWFLMSGAIFISDDLVCITCICTCICIVLGFWKSSCGADTVAVTSLCNLKRFVLVLLQNGKETFICIQLVYLYICIQLVFCIYIICICISCSLFLRVIVRSWCSCNISFQFGTNCARFVSKWKSKNHLYFVLLFCFLDFHLFTPIVWIYVHAAKLMTAVTFKTNFQFETIFASESNIYLYFCFLLQIHLFGKCVQTNRDIRNVQICAKWPLYHPHPSPLCPRWMKYHVHPHTRITYIQ